MNCPRDHVELRLEQHRGIDIDRCPACNGRWLDHDELAGLEATVPSTEDERSGMIEYAGHRSELACPKCGGPMRAFNYRAYNLEVDACEAEHGFWLDAGEDGRVRDIIAERVTGLARAADAQAGWDRLLGDIRRGGGSFWDRLSGGH